MSKSPSSLQFLDRISFPDVYRAQFYLEALEAGLVALEHQHPLIQLETIIPFLNALVDHADRGLSPTFAYEITLANAQGSLMGYNPYERCRSFFQSSTGWTANMCRVRSTYEPLFTAIGRGVGESVDNLVECLYRFHKDRRTIESSLLGSDSCIARIHLLSADRHRKGRQPILLEMEGGSRLIYKATDLTPDALFGHFIDGLELEPPYNLRYARCIVRSGYGWIEFIHHNSCDDAAQISDYYRRAGVLLAVADFLNYTDGHVENLIASGPYPVLVDTETLFQPGMQAILDNNQRSVLFTYLVQAIPEEHSGIRFGAALQAPSDRRMHLVLPQIVNDRTDEMQIRFEGVKAPDTQNNPLLNGKPQLPQPYVHEILEGYRFGFDRVAERCQTILSNDFWERLANSRPRFVPRPTVYYAMLVLLLQQPTHQNAGSGDTTAIENFLRHHLRYKLHGVIDLSRLVPYEISEISRFDIPFFYHHPTSRSIFDGNGIEYPDFFTQSASSYLALNLELYTTDYRERSAKILHREIMRAESVIS